MKTALPSAAETAPPRPLPAKSTRGSVLVAPPSIAYGSSNAEPRSRRATVRERPPTSWRKTIQPNEPSSSMSMSGESALPPGSLANASSVRSCGNEEGVSRVRRRATTRERPSSSSPQVATALPSALTATRGRSRGPSPAVRAATTSSGAPSGVHAVPSSRAAKTSPPADQTA